MNLDDEIRSNYCSTEFSEDSYANFELGSIYIDIDSSNGIIRALPCHDFLSHRWIGV